MPGLREIALNWWDNNTPTTQNVGTGTTWVGGIFQFTHPGRVAGLRCWRKTESSEAGWGIIWTNGPQTQRAYSFLDVLQGAAHFQNLWLRPWWRVPLNTDVWIAILYVGGQYARNNGALIPNPVERNYIRFHNSFQTTALWPPGAAFTPNQNANAIDVLFYPH